MGRKSAERYLIVAAIAALAAPLAAGESFAQGMIQGQTAPPAAPGPPTLFPEFRAQLKDTPAFFRDSKADVTLRSFYMNRDPVNDRNLEAWAGGGSFGLQSGWIEDFLSVGARVYHSQRLYGDKDRDGTLLLVPGQESYTVLGEAYGKLKFFDDEFVTLGRSAYDTPFINRNDVRMTPNTFQGYSLAGKTTFSGDVGLRYDIGYIDHIKERNGTKFKYMSKSAGANVENGVGMVGGTLSVGPFSLLAYEYRNADVLNIGYGEAKYALPKLGDFTVNLSAQYIDQRSIGDNKLTGSEFSTNQAGLKAEIGNWGAVLTVAYTKADDEAATRNPWSGYPGYTSVQVQDFNRAGESAMLAKISYDLGRVGLTGLTTYALAVYGTTDARAAGTAEIDEHEYDFDLEWKPPFEAVRGLSIRGRYAFVDIDQSTSRGGIHDARIIANYAFQLY